MVLDLATGEIVAHASQAYDLISGLSAGHLKQHPLDWFAATKATVAACLAKLGDRRGEVRGIVKVKPSAVRHHREIPFASPTPPV